MTSAKLLWEKTIQMPDRDGHYSFSPAHERHIRWLRTPAGTLVRQIDYHRAERTYKGFLWSETVPGKTTTETQPFGNNIEALFHWMKDADVADLNEAARRLEMPEGSW